MEKRERRKKNKKKKKEKFAWLQKLLMAPVNDSPCRNINCMGQTALHLHTP